jgi:hypothetical protein
MVRAVVNGAAVTDKVGLLTSESIAVFQIVPIQTSPFLCAPLVTVFHMDTGCKTKNSLNSDPLNSQGYSVSKLNYLQGDFTQLQ